MFLRHLADRSQTRIDRLSRNGIGSRLSNSIGLLRREGSENGHEA